MGIGHKVPAFGLGDYFKMGVAAVLALGLGIVVVHGF